MKEYHVRAWMVGGVILLLFGLILVPRVFSMQTEKSPGAIGERFSKPIFQQSSILQVPYLTEDAGGTPAFPVGFENRPDIIQEESAKPSAEISYEELLKRLESLEKSFNDQIATESAKKKEDAKRPTVKVTGRIHLDGTYFDSDDVTTEHVGNMQDGVEFRRAKFGLFGGYLDQYFYRMEIDFGSGGSAAIKDAYAEMTQLPILSSVRVGHFREAISTETLTSSNFTWFIERSAASRSISNYIGDRSLGIAFSNGVEKKDWSWNIGLYRHVTDRQVRYWNDVNGYKMTTRLTKLFYENEESGHFLHGGFAYSLGAFDPNEDMRWDATLESNLANPLISTGFFKGTNYLNTCAPEFIWAKGRLAVQSDVYLINMQNDLIGEKNFTGGFAQIGYSLTGEHYQYEKERGCLGAIKPKKNFVRRCDEGKWETGSGAWWIGYRFSWIDLSWNGGNTAGKLAAHTCGLNWQLTPYCRWMFNVNHTNTRYSDETTGKLNASSAALQVYF